MKIFKISHGTFGYDQYMGFVIVSQTEEMVRLLARNNSADEGKEVWNEAEIEEIGNYTGTSQSAFILMSDFRAG